MCIFEYVSSRIALYWNKHFRFILLIKHFCLNFVYLKFSDYFLAEKSIYLIFSLKFNLFSPSNYTVSALILIKPGCFPPVGSEVSQET